MKFIDSKWNIENYDLCETGVEFSSENHDLKAVFDDCEALSLKNKKRFGDYEVLIEGAKYNGVWLETQPLGGEMYAKRDLKTALANILIFLRYQRRDGKFPGMISYRDAWQGVAAHYDWMQGCFLPYSAFRLYYLIGKDKDYLRMLYTAFADFDEYLWSCRDSTGDGCLESWCIWDTGEDNCTVQMLHGLRQPDHGAYGASTPPKDRAPYPYKSPQYMGYSYALRKTLADISSILENGEEDHWREMAEAVKQRAKEVLWDENRHAFFMKDASGKQVNALTQENIKCLYLGLMTHEMADLFIKEHLLCENEFWTPYPFPAIAANDPYFHVNAECSNCADRLAELGTAAHDIDDNSWSGPLSGLVWQRSIDALLNYGYHTELTLVGKKILSLLMRERKYVQNYHPFTGAPSRGENGYGPTMLSALEFISLLSGVNIVCDKIIWSIADGMGAFCYTQKMLGKRYTLDSDGMIARAYIDDTCIFEVEQGVRIETNLDGEITTVFGIGAERIKLLYHGKKIDMSIKNNEAIVFQ